MPVLLVLLDPDLDGEKQANLSMGAVLSRQQAIANSSATSRPLLRLLHPYFDEELILETKIVNLRMIIET
jgi:hypothetical protein